MTSALTALLLASAPLIAVAEVADLGKTLSPYGYLATPGKESALWKPERDDLPTIATRDRNPRIVVDGVRVWLGERVTENQGRRYVDVVDRDRTILPLVAPKPETVGPVRLVVLDPGHGGKDSGTRNPGLALEEKTMAVDVVKRLKSILETRGYRVLVTRSLVRDDFVALPDRPAFANRNKADLFVSVHFNAAGLGDLPDSSGFETYCLTPESQYSTRDRFNRSGLDTSRVQGNTLDDANILLAHRIQKRLTYRLEGEDRGVRRARWAVLRDLECPGVLVECGFLSNVAEAKRIATPVYRERIAESLAAGIADYAKPPVTNPAARHDS